MAYIIISSEGEEIARQNLRGTTRIGRSPECDISIHDHLMSRQHCRLQTSKGKWTLVDLASRNGTFVNGERIERRVLNDHDALLVGTTTITYRTGVAPALRATGRAKVVRPADPFEALAGTVFAYELKAPQAALQTLAGRPVPRPAPLAPAGYEQEGVGTLVLEMLSDVHDSRLAQRPATRQPKLGRANLPRPADPRSPVVAELHTPQVKIPKPTTVVHRTVAAVSEPVDSALQAIAAAQQAHRAPMAVAAPRRKRSGFALDLCMGGLMVGLLGVVVVATRALFMLHA